LKRQNDSIAKWMLQWMEHRTSEEVLGPDFRKILRLSEDFPKIVLIL